MTAPSADDVVIPRKTLRGLRSLVAGVILGVLALVAAVGMALAEGQRRCEAGNEFRSRDLPAAFRLHDQHLGRALGASDDAVSSFSDDFEADLAELFPPRDCSLL